MQLTRNPYKMPGRYASKPAGKSTREMGPDSPTCTYKKGWSRFDPTCDRREGATDGSPESRRTSSARAHNSAPRAEPRQCLRRYRVSVFGALC